MKTVYDDTNRKPDEKMAELKEEIRTTVIDASDLVSQWEEQSVNRETLRAGEYSVAPKHMHREPSTRAPATRDGRPTTGPGTVRAQ